MSEIIKDFIYSIYSDYNIILTNIKYLTLIEIKYYTMTIIKYYTMT